MLPGCESASVEEDELEDEDEVGVVVVDDPSRAIRLVETGVIVANVFDDATAATLTKEASTFLILIIGVVGVRENGLDVNVFVVTSRIPFALSISIAVVVVVTGKSAAGCSASARGRTDIGNTTAIVKLQNNDIIINVSRLGSLFQRGFISLGRYTVYEKAFVGCLCV